jgi:peptide/nickel transport system ATP-binding protein
MTSLLELQGIVRAYELRQALGALRRRKTTLLACDHVDLDIHEAEIVGLVGESGSGKSTLARIAILLERPDEGRVRFAGADLLALGPRALRAARRNFQIVFQDPTSSLNPRWRIGQSIARPLQVHGLSSWPSVDTAVAELLERVALPADFAHRYPHELSGGQRQRACIARALALRPKLIVADEPVSALDVSTQAQILELLLEVRTEFGTAILFISHDLRVVRHLSDRVAVMREGRIVEFRETAPLYSAPEHDYTRTLLESVIRPRYRPDKELLSNG